MHKIRTKLHKLATSDLISVNYAPPNSAKKYEQFLNSSFHVLLFPGKSELISTRLTARVLIALMDFTAVKHH